MKQKLTTTMVNSYEFTKREFGKAIYIDVAQSQFTVVQIGDHTDATSRREGVKEHKWSVCVNSKVYAKHFGLADPSWLLTVCEDEEYVAVTQEYMDAYLSDSHHRWYERKVPVQQDILPVLESGKLNLVVRREDGGLLYDLEDSLIPRSIFVDQIMGDIRGGRYYMKKVFDHLSKHPKVSNLEKDKIPSYNAEYPGETHVEFLYSPEIDEFHDLIVMDTFERNKKITETLGLKQFERESKKESEDD